MTPLYRKYIRPMHSYPGPDYSPRVMPIEEEVKWYPEEEREQLENKYASYKEGSFSNLVFEEKYEPYHNWDYCYEAACLIIMAFDGNYPSPNVLELRRALLFAATKLNTTSTKEIIKWAKEYAKEWFDKNMKEGEQE